MSALISTHRFPVQAFGLAVLVEAALVAVVVIFLVTTPSKPALSEPVPITLISEDKPPAEAPPTPKPPEPLKPVARPQPKPITKVVPPKPQIQTPQPPKAAIATAEPLPLSPAPSAMSEPAFVPTTPAPPPAVASGKTDVSLEYAAKVRAAVQAAVAYPPAAAALHFSGRVRVEFHLRDGVPSQSRVVISSAIGMIDRAALQSVQSARYPEPPSDMRGSDKLYQIWVEFTR
ncbi:TonB family protein [Glaciimonas immobilis]|uniref:Protein TonB n=1 Tax=Glaciimonas immobilis TaxID=728004 RepID=A0A840RQC4_9BURK|nr:TonB family protein [Glaciimonas immobilis]KAF3998112.1 TonB family protein [Glaciimonas immobilis]MBB5199188.1 protein TonB [Glaciimonas immobilis]